MYTLHMIEGFNAESWSAKPETAEAEEGRDERLERLRAQREQLREQMAADSPSDASRSDNRTMERLTSEIKSLEAEEAKERIPACESFDELYSALKKIGEIETSRGGTMDAAQIISEIKAIRENAGDNGVPDMFIRAVPRAHGTRAAVERLLEGGT